MDLFEAIRTCWAVRRFTAEPVTDDEIRKCLDAAIRAPSGGNLQPWQFLVVTDAATRRSVGDLYRRAYDRYEPALLAARKPYRDSAAEENFQRISRSARHLAEHMGEVPAIVMFLMPDISMTLEDAQGPLDVGTPYASVYPAVQNFMLAARGLGIGTTLTTAYRIYQQELRYVCGIPEVYEIVALVAMGRPRYGFGQGKRRPVASLTHWNRFGDKR
jgi:nitroreductase